MIARSLNFNDFSRATNGRPYNFRCDVNGIKVKKHKTVCNFQSSDIRVRLACRPSPRGRPIPRKMHINLSAKPVRPPLLHHTIQPHLFQPANSQNKTPPPLAEGEPRRGGSLRGRGSRKIGAYKCLKIAIVSPIFKRLSPLSGVSFRSFLVADDKKRT